MRPAVPMECAEQPMARPLTNGEDALKIAGKLSRRAFPREAPMHPVMRMDATANLGSHSGPTAFDPSMPRADITERCRSGNESGAGMLNGDWTATAASAETPSETHPETPQVPSTQRKSPASSSQRPVVLNILTPRPVTAAGSHWKSLSPTPAPPSKYGAEGPTKRVARLDDTAQMTSGCRTRCSASGSSLANASEPTVVLSSHIIPMGRCRPTGRPGSNAVAR
mmetsp:Transcript_70732/g.153605  ORF Transcript_70732/g.153605 Transcript_70732/m.153605 type:complete len:224 (+) Transcript_70732:221-892(+)